MFDQSLSRLFVYDKMHNIKVWQIAEKTLPSGRVGQNAKRCAIASIQKRHPYPSASYGAFVCPRNAIRFQAGALASALAGTYSGIHDIATHKYHGTSVSWERTRYGKGMLITSNQKEFFQLLFIVFEYT